MCGIVGQIRTDGEVNVYNFTQMRDTLVHRGPDDAGSEYFEQKRIALGHRRLSFVDLSLAGRQPMSNEDDTNWIVFNGEIYNYIELRKQLEQASHKFKTHTDTEVILHGYEQWGCGFVNRLKGMFAFGLLDLNRRKLILTRDRFGIKPLYYTALDDQFVFASELKAIMACKDVKREVDLTAVADYLVYRYVPSPKTIWKGISKLPPAHTLVVDIDSLSSQSYEYWKLSFSTKNRAMPEEMVNRFGAMLAESIAIHARADVPIGSFLSGGYDSSAVVHYLKEAGHRPETFAIGFEGWDNSEHQYAALVANCLAVPFNYSLATESTLDLLDIMPDVYDEPIADISILPTWLVSHEAAKKVKAVMSGEGADELLGGYWWQKKIFALCQFERTWKEKFARLFRRTPDPDPVDRLEFYAEASAMGRFDRNELEKAFHPELHHFLPADPEWFYRQHFDKKLSALKSFQRMDIKCFMGELVLTKVDRASMASSLEVRVPFLDHEMFEYVLSAAEQKYFRPNITKFLLHDNIESHLPEEIMNRAKQGFVGPDDFYINIDRYRSILTDSKIVASGMIRQDYVDGLFETADHWRLWKLAVLEGWYNRWASVGDDSLMPRQYVFVVCGAREHTDTLHFALKALQRYSKQEIVVVTDLRRNEAAIDWHNVIDVTTPAHFNHHQASIYLKTRLHRSLPKGRLYCYLDTDVIAVDGDVDTIFDQYIAPVSFAPDHCTMSQFSSYAVKCECGEIRSREMQDFAVIMKLLREHPPSHNWDKDYPGWTWLPDERDWMTPSGHRVTAMRCHHLGEQIALKFGINIRDQHWQHWNGGVFLFGDEGHQFMETWHKKTLAIFADPMWRTRDQGTLIATAWEYDLQDTPTLPNEYNLIVDYNKGDEYTVSADGQYLSVGPEAAICRPLFVHVFHHFGDEDWDIWNWVSSRVEGTRAGATSAKL